jgi:phage I-like protein
LSEAVKTDTKKPRATLATGKTGIEALLQLAQAAPKAPSGTERLAAARAEKDKKITALLTPQVAQVIKGLRAKGYGYGVIANTVNDTLNADVKISTRHVKTICEPAQAAPQPVRQ